MGKRLLHIVATPRGLASNTGRVSSVVLDALDERYEDLDVTTLDLFGADLPAVAGVNIKSKYSLMTGQPLDAEARDSWAEIEREIEGFVSADLFLLTVPMWNFGIPYVLKYYLDAIVQPGYLFAYDEHGRPQGMVHGKKMVVVTSSGGDYVQEPLASLNFVEPYLRTIFGLVGITDIKFFTVGPMDVTPELRRTAHKQAVTDAKAWVADGAWDAMAVVPHLVVPEGAKPAVLAVE